MPFYTFRCPDCGVEEEILQSMDSSNPICEKCKMCGCNRADGTCGCGAHKVEMGRVFKSVSKPLFKGSGFYETDYKDKTKPG